MSNKHYLLTILACALLAGCKDSDDDEVLQQAAPVPTDEQPANSEFGKANDVFAAEEWYAGGELGTTRKASYSAATAAVDLIDNGLDHFKKGEDFFENQYTISSAPRKGLGPAWVRSGCIYCHPSYGHGKRQENYRAGTYGNGYLLVIYHPTAGNDGDGVAYAANSYVRHVTGMPQTKAMSPFKAPIEEEQITIDWKKVTAMESGLPMEFPDGEKYELIYPEVTIPQSAFNTIPKPDNYEVRLESTIGIYGTGLLDAIEYDDMKAEYQRQAESAKKRGKDVKEALNPAMWDGDANDWASTAWYKLADGTMAIKKFTYAMTRASLQDGAGSNAIWNITNVTRSDRHYLYTSKQWAKAMSEDESVISYIKEHGASATSLLYPYYADGTDEGIRERVNMLLGLNSAADAPTFKKYFVDGAPFNGEEEMSDKDYYDFMVWHRGLAVPAARNLNDNEVKRGKQVFTELGCTQCHRPSWKTGNDNYWVDNSIKAYAQSVNKDVKTMLPKYPNQTIYPYTDLVQHRLRMANDIRTGWCRTTPLWGRGLSMRLTGANDRLHDCRARNELEAIMWHGYSKQSDAYWCTEKFYNLPKADRDAVIKFLQSI